MFVYFYWYIYSQYIYILITCCGCCFVIKLLPQTTTDYLYMYRMYVCCLFNYLLMRLFVLVLVCLCVWGSDQLKTVLFVVKNKQNL